MKFRVFPFGGRCAPEAVTKIRACAADSGGLRASVAAPQREVRNHIQKHPLFLDAAADLQHIA
jgi:hypothetical protein